MARKQYQSQVLASTAEFISQKKDIENQPGVSAETTNVSVKKEITVEKEPETKKSTEENNNSVMPDIDLSAAAPQIDINALLDVKIQEALQAKKNGRPKGYEEETTVVSVRMELSVYEFARNQSHKQRKSMTQYIKELIKKEMERVEAASIK